MLGLQALVTFPATSMARGNARKRCRGLRALGAGAFATLLRSFAQRESKVWCYELLSAAALSSRIASPDTFYLHVLRALEASENANVGQTKMRFNNNVEL